MVGQVLPADTEQVGQLGRIAGRVTQGEQQPGSRRIGQGMAEPGEDSSVRHRLHTDDSTAGHVFTEPCITVAGAGSGGLRALNRAPCEVVVRRTSLSSGSPS
jgi:hypothetical protein